jgi:uncharacterized protein YllA (UPF0747 family)
MIDKTNLPKRDMTFSADRLEALLDSALEHAAHGWTALERETKVHRTNPDSWPPQVEARVGSAEYHLSAMVMYVFAAYGIVSKEMEHTEDVMEKVKRALGT